MAQRIESTSLRRKCRMSVIHLHKHLDSETLHVPELKPLVGKNVEIIVREETRTTNGTTPAAENYNSAGTQESPEQVELRRLRLLLEEQAAFNRSLRDEAIRELLED
jgi:hypothetical protein